MDVQLCSEACDGTFAEKYVIWPVALPPPHPASNQMGGMLGFGKGRAFALGSLVQSYACGGVAVLPVLRLLTPAEI